ncbi:MAG: hypothetical protein GY861_04810, partial [bacterium]|nr:hypothetical protein [bacterium]
MKILKDKQHSLLMQIINNNRLFDRRDNTFLKSNREAAKTLKVSSSTVDRLFRVLKQHGLINKVRNQLYNKQGEENKKLVEMLSPRFLFISYTPSDRWIVGALWELKDIQEVYKWRLLCEELNCYINPLTGEVKDFNWYEIECRAQQYTAFDRCYRKGSKCKYMNDDVENQSQHYTLNEADCSGLTTYDYLWLDSLNGWSALPYNRQMKFYT